MTFMELIEKKGHSRYSLSRLSGVPWSTLSDICSGKTSLSSSSAQTLSKLSEALEISIEEMLRLETVHDDRESAGKPEDKEYLETNLSPHLRNAIEEYKRGEKESVSYLDCLWGELYGSINADFWSGCISEEQAEYLREKYLYREECEGNDD
ncbi:helix-turn-helix domain-containing protein [Bacilliculturomica massiliensis]|uniref:helix-turn-helix domain-containing protein n=1 Tax=Bacilliculturomica massiliensis TaxID=1917867 RepID=UPI00103067DA|nr:helix-turn-helix transcriptional regulator [Bacilliculturomica massiliensis]